MRVIKIRWQYKPVGWLSQPYANTQSIVVDSEDDWYWYGRPAGVPPGKHDTRFSKQHYQEVK